MARRQQQNPATKRNARKRGLSERDGAGLLACAAGALAAAAVVLAPACNDHVFQVVENECERTLEQEVVIAEDIPADILIVVDNSGSMCEEQDNLKRNFFDPNCPITDLNNVPPEYKNPNNDIVAELAQNCGFIQLLAAYDNAFRVGVITTDVGPCDNRFGFAEDEEYAQNICGGQAFPNWGRRPQRGCLQAPPGAEQKYIQKGDEDIGQRFNETIDNIQTFGSAFERGLDAMEVFLDPNTTTAPGCEDDRASFIRPNAKLIVIFLSDEEDCSHADGEYGFVDEHDTEQCSNAIESFPQTRNPPASSGSCYDQPELLAPVDRYVDFLKAVKGTDRDGLVSTAVIAGGIRNANGNIVPSGCTISNDGQPNNECRNSRGASLFNGPGDICDPNDPAGPCCAADPGSRYFDFADKLGNSLTDSICYESFRQTMVRIAQFIAAEDVLILSEAPKNQKDIHVYLCANDAENIDACDTIERIPNGEDPTGRNGWQLSGDRTVQAYGTAIPQPGQSLKVFALANRVNDGEGACVVDDGADAGN